MRVGAMRQRVTLQQEMRIPDGAGGYALSWSDIATVWAEIITPNGRETLAAGRLEGRTVYRLRVRWRNDVTSALRIVWGTRLLNIRAVLDPTGQQRFLEILADEGGAV